MMALLLAMELLAGAAMVAKAWLWKTARRYGRHAWRSKTPAGAVPASWGRHRRVQGRHRTEQHGNHWILIAEPIAHDLVLVGDTA